MRIMSKSWFKKQIKEAQGEKVTYTIAERLDNWWYDLWCYIRPFRKIRDGYYDVRNYLFHRYDLIRTGLNPTSWWDKDSLILYGMMGLIVDFVEKEKCFEVVEWDSEPEHKHAGEEIKAIYAWWKDYPRRQKEIDDTTQIWYESKREDSKLRKNDERKTVESPNHFFNCPQSERTKSLLDLSWELEQKLIEEEQDMLHRIIKIRKFLWT